MQMGSPCSEAAHAGGDVLHSECDCCEHAAKRTVTLRQSIEHAIGMIEGGYPGEAVLDLDRVLACLNEWCNDPTVAVHPPAVDTDYDPARDM